MGVMLLQVATGDQATGVAKGKWEAPAWFFILVLAIAVLVPAVVFILKRVREARERAPTSLRPSIPPSMRTPPKEPQ